jgi:hypothetical protein
LVGEGDETSDNVFERLNELLNTGKISGMLEYVKHVGPIRDRGLYHNLAIIIDDIFMISVIPETNEELLRQIEKYK